MLTLQIIRLVLFCVLLRLLTIEEGLLGLRHTLISTSFSHLSCHSLATGTTALRVDIWVAILAALQKLLSVICCSRIGSSTCFNCWCVQWSVQRLGYSHNIRLVSHFLTVDGAHVDRCKFFICDGLPRRWGYSIGLRCIFCWWFCEKNLLASMKSSLLVRCSIVCLLCLVWIGSLLADQIANVMVALLLLWRLWDAALVYLLR